MLLHKWLYNQVLCLVDKAYVSICMRHALELYGSNISYLDMYPLFMAIDARVIHACATQSKIHIVIE